MTRRPARRRTAPRRLALLALAGLLVVTPACSSDDDTSSAASTTADAGATTTSDDAAVELGDPDGVDPLPPLPEDVALPIVFVHGFAGSAQQYESQAMRFVANGYPQDRVVAYDHDGSGLDYPAYAEGLEAVVDDTLAATGAEKIYLVGHSRGTRVSTLFLEDEANATKVAKLVLIDGQGCPEGDVPCLAPNQAMFPGQAHVEVATSPESFAAQYEFLVGETPEVVDLVAQKAPVEIAGRAVNFPLNTGRAGATLTVWAVDAATGQRSGDEPVIEVTLDDDGAFEAIQIEAGAHYEFALTTEGSPVTHHLYPQPYLRSSHLVRLLSSPPDGPTRTNTNATDDHSSLIAIRMREWYGTGDAADRLTIQVDDGEPLEAVNGATGNGGIGIHIHDDAATPGESTSGPLPYFSEQPFQSGIDLFLPATPDGSGTISVTNVPRGDADRPQVINVPNWPSSSHAISVVFTDWPVDGAAG
jgi:pimeloyl-ACP methyl ester carboxylesterase